LEGFDYSQSGAYFVTLCAHDRRCYLGDAKAGFIELSPIGEIAKQFWSEIPIHFDNVTLDYFVVMPNHVHGVLLTSGIHNVGVQYIEPLRSQKLPRQQHQYQKVIPKSIGSIIRSYKAAVTRWCRKNGYKDFRWQRNYHEHVIRNEHDLNEIREYIMNNPLKWELDKENPKNWKTKF